MAIHREGWKIIGIITLILVLIDIVCLIFARISAPFAIALVAASVLFLLFILRFFRRPIRRFEGEDNLLISPADGKVVVIEETTEEEYFGDKRLQLSIFMSVWDVHINYFPVSGKVRFYKYHPGDYLVARHPKSSTLNERNTIVLETALGKQLLLRQIAGFVARKISCYCKEGDEVSGGQEMGFIKFGSRVDIFLPPGSEILVPLGTHVTGKLTPIARLK